MVSDKNPEQRRFVKSWTTAMDWIWPQLSVVIFLRASIFYDDPVSISIRGFKERIFENLISCLFGQYRPSIQICTKTLKD